jgi:hypothetical protein
MKFVGQQPKILPNIGVHSVGYIPLVNFWSWSMYPNVRDAIKFNHMLRDSIRLRPPKILPLIDPYTSQ